MVQHTGVLTIERTPKRIMRSMNGHPRALSPEEDVLIVGDDDDDIDDLLPADLWFRVQPLTGEQISTRTPFRSRT